MKLSEMIPEFGISAEWNREQLAERLIDLWLLDSGTATDIAMLPWVRDGITGWDNPMLRALLVIFTVDIELGKQVAGFAWMNSGPAEAEWVWLTGMGNLALQDLELARAVAEVPWFTDEGSGYASIVHLADIASKDIELARIVAGLPWFTDGTTLDEALTLFYLDRILSTHPGIALEMVGRPWFTDGVTGGDWSKVQRLEPIVSWDPELARRVLELPLSEDLANHLLSALYGAVSNEPDVASQVRSQPWVQDGLNQEEMAFMVALLEEAMDSTYGNYALFESLLESRFTQSKTVSLPLTGDANIWVFQSAPFSPGEDVPTVIEEILSSLEGFMGSPIPTTDIVVLIEVLPKDLHFPWFRGLHHGSHIRVSRDYGKDLEHLMSTIIHELAHYYRFSPAWFNESFAHLMEEYVSQKLGVQSMVEVSTKVSERVQRYCSREDIANIRHALFFDEFFRITKPGDCTRALGLRFLHHTFVLMGEERIATALRGLSIGYESRAEAAEETIFRTLLSNTHPDRQEEFRDLYRRLHGGPYTDPDVDRSDDHGDSEKAATVIAEGDVVVGTLDYSFDFDYFSFQAQENQKFRFELDHETLRADNVIVLTSAGNRTAVKANVRVSSGILVQWIAPSSGIYYFAVLNWRGDAGQYSLRITHVPDVLDDHGDSPNAATEIAVGETIRGIVDDDFDLDYFRIPVVAGEFYSVRIIGAALRDCCVGWSPGGDSKGFGWWESTTGERYIVVHGGHENTGAYELVVTSE